MATPSLFHLARLPVDWGTMPEEAVQRMLSTLDGTREEQAAQVMQRIKSWHSENGDAGATATATSATADGAAAAAGTDSS